MTTQDDLKMIVQGSIKLNQDLEKLEDLAAHWCPENESINKFKEVHVNMYLDNYNTLLHKSKLHYDGQGQFSVKGMSKQVARHKALWKTYVSMLEYIGIDTQDWTYNPKQRRLL